MKFVVALLAVLALARGESCGNPTVTQSIYTTTERQLSEETAFIVKFGLTCSSGAEDVALYADVNGRQYPVTKSPEESTYQLSWFVDATQSPKGSYVVRIFDDEGINALRKAIRNEEDTSGVKSMFNIDVTHPGSSRNLWLTSEAVGLLLAGLIYYGACKLRGEVLN